jgi:hypothetical protein
VPHVAPKEVQEAADDASSKAPNPLASLFGSKRAPAAEEVRTMQLQTSLCRFRCGFARELASIFLTAQRRSERCGCAQDEEPKDSKPLFGFGSGTRKVKASAAQPAAPPARKVRGGTQAIRAGSGAEDDPPPKPRSGFLGLGGTARPCVTCPSCGRVRRQACKGRTCIPRLGRPTRQ